MEPKEHPSPAPDWPSRARLASSGTPRPEGSSPSSQDLSGGSSTVCLFPAQGLAQLRLQSSAPRGFRSRRTTSPCPAWPKPPLQGSSWSKFSWSALAAASMPSRLPSATPSRSARQTRPALHCCSRRGCAWHVHAVHRDTPCARIARSRLKLGRTLPASARLRGHALQSSSWSACPTGCTSRGPRASHSRTHPIRLTGPPRLEADASPLRLAATHAVDPKRGPLAQASRTAGSATPTAGP